ncbi:hypothetical protein I203_108002 [Kwoniella mangroviensis CBS 8507]|uniref:hypothetical protein n=1 Tax=Kwoniella mangroviensis CBS 8507 TaxID=1296122 RepID=UPI00080D20EC|nr:uncharacterized protein I203_04896 [Kwoniella mangroviensis CBS 8507]OCF65876.1 hypothetical protein I203_04896 [Kwoniella mangroviensis CBS 8507]
MNLWQSAPMHWQTYTTSTPLTPQLEEAFRRQASQAFRCSHQSIGYSVSSSFTTHNGVTTGTTQLQVGKATPWSTSEIAAVEGYLVGLVPKGNLLGPSGTPVGYIESAPPSALSSTRIKKRSGSKPTAPSLTSFPSTVSEAGTVSPSVPPPGMQMTMATSPTNPTGSNHVHYEDLPYHQPQGGNSNRFSSITRKFKKKSTSMGN